MEIEETCRKLKPILGDKITRLWKIYLSEDLNGKKEIESLLNLLYDQNFGACFAKESILLVPPPAHIAKGEYPLGKIIYGSKELHEFGLREEDWIQHIAIFGRSGSGKTNVAFIILANLLLKKKPFLIFDWKRNYRDLLAKKNLNNEILVYTPGRNIAPFSFNPLIPPPGTAPTTWLKKLIEIIAGSYYLGEGVMYLLQKAINAVYKSSGVYDGNPAAYPTLKDVQTWLQDYPAKGREMDWMASTMRAVSALCFGEIGKVINVAKQSNLQDLLSKNVILELDGLTHTDKTFLIQAFLLWIHHFRLQEGEREHFKHAILIEEAHNILLNRDKMSKETIMDTVLREIRELGESIILIDQMQSKITTTALANTGMSINMNQKNKADVQTAANSLLLENDDKEYLGKLPVGYAIVKLQHRWFEPFLVKFPHIHIKKGLITDEQIKSGTRTCFTVFQGDKPAISPNPGISTDDKIGEDENNLLLNVLKNPLLCLTEHYKELNLGRRRGNDAKVKLIEKGLVEQNRVNLTYGFKIMLKLTSKGRKYLGLDAISNGISCDHKYWLKKAREYYENKGFAVFENFKTFDLLVRKGTLKAVVEIETGKSNPMKNIRDALAAGLSVISAATNNAAYEKIQAAIQKEGLENAENVKVILAPRAYNGKSNGIIKKWIK